MTFARFARAFLVYLLFVILFGAWVRITHSGAGCGSHWPTCHGEIIPFEPSTETIIEFTHRITSGILGIFGLILAGWAWVRHRAGRVFTAAMVTLALIVFEALIGAGIVLKELVTDDASVARAVVISIHLANTLLLTAAASLTAFWDAQPQATGTATRAVNTSRTLAACAVGLLLLVATCMSGAVTALGDTLFPVDPNVSGLFSRLSDDLSPANHFLIRLRIVHPIIAVVAALYTLVLAYKLNDARDRVTADLSIGLGIATIAQLAAGFVNIGLAAPGWMQLLHLLLAQVVWIFLVLLTAQIRGPR